MLKKYADFCYRQVGSYALYLVDYMEALRPQLSKSGIGVTLPEYISMLIFTSFTAGTFVFVLFGVLLTLMGGLSGVIMALILSIFAVLLVSALFYIYPEFLIRSRASKIKDTLPFAAMYLSTLAGTGTSINQIFANMAEVDEYGEVSKEAEKITRDVETFGMDINEALKRAAQRSPSEDFSELMWGINHVVTTGGSLQEFLQQRSDKLMTDYQRRIEEFSESLSLLVEMYITLIIVGSIVFTSMSAVMSSFSTSISSSMLVNVQVAAIFFGLPVVSIMFIILVDGLSPGGIR